MKKLTSKNQTIVPIPEVVERLGMSRSAVYREINTGKIPSVRFGKSIRIPRDAFEDFIACGRKPVGMPDISEIVRLARIEILKTDRQRIDAELKELEAV